LNSRKKGPKYSFGIKKNFGNNHDTPGPAAYDLDREFYYTRPSSKIGT